MTMIEVPAERQDKFGFYQVGDFRTYSKFEAIEQHTKTNKKLQWNFNDTIYRSYKWDQEPKESLSELYRQRAQQIREQYDYVVLWFSGGADSTNILNAFIDNNIKLDEVAS
jgi:asparagine synthetase B (glutamine-hydrolysing)